MLEGDVVLILVGPYKGRNGLVHKMVKDKLLLVVDPFGKKIWLNKGDVK